MHQVNRLHDQLITNNNDISIKMEGILAEYLNEQRAQSQEKFWNDFKNSDIVMRGLSKSMDNDLNLKAAIHAVANNDSTDEQEKDVLLALLTELSGQPVTILPVIAKRVIAHNNGRTPADSANTLIEVDDEDLIRHPSIVSLANTEVKSELNSPLLFQTPTAFPIDPALTTPTQPADNGNAGLTTVEPLERNFPGLLQQLRENEVAKPLPKAVAQSLGPAKRARQDFSGSPPTSTRITKKIKTGRDIGK